MNFEDSVFGNIRQCNSIAAMDRLRELLDENHTNSIKVASAKDGRVKPIVWFLATQVWDSLGVVDLHAEFAAMYEKHKTNLISITGNARYRLIKSGS